MPIIPHVNPRHRPHARTGEAAATPAGNASAVAWEHVALDWACGFGGSLGERSAYMHE
jgi:hypothetical protein